MKHKLPNDVMKLAALVAKEQGIPLDDLVSETVRRMQETHKRLKSKNGKFKVMGIDKFSNEDWVHGEYKTSKEALDEARRMTRESMGYATDSSIATVYYAYSPDGKYLGGDTWHNE